MNGLYFPVVRTQIAQIFGAENFGTSLAAVATIQQLCQLVAPVAFTSIYKAPWGTTKVGPIRGVVYMIAAGLAAISTICICLTPVKSKAESEAKKPKGEEGGYADPLLADEGVP
jgi:hypothetical protein